MLREAPWWPEFVDRLVDEPLTDLADRFGAGEQDLIDALVGGASTGAVTDESWWPEAVRRIGAGMSLREVARTFGTTPRRIRRGLARAGLRVGGEVVGDEGLPSLGPFRGRLGLEPDATIASGAGVPVEAVQGERRRLGIEAYSRPAALDDEADDAWLAPPPPTRQKEKRARPWLEDDLVEPTVIRRPVGRRVLGVGLGRVEATPPARGEVALPSRDSDEEDAALTVEQRRSRRGRMRIVRPGEDRQGDGGPLSIPPTESPSITRRRKVNPHGEVRLVHPETVGLPNAASSSRRKAPAEQPGAGPPPTPPAPPYPARAEPPAAPPPEADVVLSRAAPLPEPPRAPPAPAEPSGSPEPAAPRHPVKARQPRATATRRAPAAPRPVDPTARPAPRFGWRVTVAGRAAPLVVLATSLVDAVRIAAEHLPGQDLKVVDVERALPELGRD